MYNFILPYTAGHSNGKHFRAAFKKFFDPESGAIIFGNISPFFSRAGESNCERYVLLTRLSKKSVI